MALGALPPDLSMAALSQFLQRQLSVERGVPLPCQVRKKRCHIVEPRQSFFPGAVGAAGALDAAEHTRLVLMPQLTPPPDLLRAALPHFRGQQLPVFQRVPLGGKLRVSGRKVCLSWDGPHPRTVGTPGALHQRERRGFPLMPPVALPPNLAVAGGRQSVGPQHSVAGRMPELRDLRVERG